MAERRSRRVRSANRTRSLIRIRPDFVKDRPDRSSSRSTDVSEVKILNTDLIQKDSDMFIEVCDTFERLLQELNLSENSHRVQDKLLRIGDLIEKKVSLAKKSKKSSGSLLKSASLSVNDLSRSGQNRLSESTNDSDKGISKFNGSRFKEFMKEVNCPFCSEIQSDKVSFVKHLDSCSVHLKKEFKKEAHFPYSAFQILPNNLIKCNICHNQVQENLRHYYDHTQCQTHRRSYASAAKIRDYDSRLFCACCKALVYNTYTQIKGHIDQEAHKMKCELKKTTADYLRGGIHFLFTESSKFKCLDCPPTSTVCTTPKSALEHLDSSNHKKHKKKNTFYSTAIYCEVCLVQVQMYEIISHFSSVRHCANEKKLKEESFEVCFCCNFFCKSLSELSNHMESECDEINDLREKIPKESQQENEGKKGNISKGPSITVKNCTKIPALFRYFTQFGEIATIESHNDKDVVIEFREKSAVDDVLLLQEVIVMDGTKLEIVIDSNSGKSVEKPKPEPESENEASERSSKSEDDADLGDDASMFQDGRLDELFARVSNYLMNTAQKSESLQQTIIKMDCAHTLEVDECHIVGFSGSGLSFPSETLNLFCEGLRNLSQVSCFFRPSIESQVLTEILAKALRERLFDSELWKNVDCDITPRPYPFFDCVHGETEKACRIFVNEWVLVLTDMLRECMEKSELVKPFCLMIRFWFSVHELKIKDSEFALISLLVFFLLNGNVVELFEEKYTKADKARFYMLSKKQVEVFPGSSWNLKPVVSVKELFQKFLQFMGSFDFDKYAICLPLRCPVPRSACSEIGVPLWTSTKNTDGLKSDSIYILDSVSCANLAADIDHKHKKEFLKIVRTTVRHYKIK